MLQNTNDPQSVNYIQLGGHHHELVEKVRDEWLNKVSTVPDFFEELSRMEMGTVQNYAGRYPFELIQNAADAARKVSKQDAGRILFELTAINEGNQSLIVANDGLPFSEMDLRAICRLGKSCKDARDSIGHKGLGFKSIIDITSKPFIFSGGMAFYFDKQATIDTLIQTTNKLWQLDDVQLLRVPFPASINDLTLAERNVVVRAIDKDRYATVMCFPLRRPAKEVLEHLWSLDPRVLLFLFNLKSIRIVSPERSRLLECIQKDSHATLRVDGETISFWRVAQKTWEIPNDVSASVEDPSWHNVKAACGIVAIPVDATDIPQFGQIQPIFVYLPTEMTAGVPIALHADFYLRPDRKDALNVRYNQWLTDQIIDFIVKCQIPLMIELCPKSSAVTCAFIIRASAAGFGKYIAKRLKHALSSQTFVLTNEDSHEKPADTRFGPAGIKPGSLHTLFKHSRQKPKRLVHPDIELDQKTSRFLIECDAQRLTNGELCELIASLLPDVEDSLYIYEFLVDWWKAHPHTAEFQSALSQHPILKCQSGYYTCPNDKVFLSKESIDIIEIPDILKVHVLDRSCIAGPKGKDIETFLISLGVKEYNYRDIARSSVYPLFEDGQPDLELSDLMQVHRFLRAYSESAVRGRVASENELGRVRVSCRDSDGLLLQKRATQVYFGGYWGCDDLQTAYCKFDDCYFLEPLEGGEEEQNRWRIYYEWLGVLPRPRLFTVNCKIAPAQMATNHTLANQCGWVEYIESLGAQVRCGSHPQKSQLLPSYYIEHFADLVRDGNRAGLTALYRLLAIHWSYYADKLNVVIECEHGWCSGSTKKRCVESYLAWSLRNAPWVPTVVFQKPEKVLRRPQQIWRIGPGQSERIQQLLPALDLKLDRPEFEPFRASLRIVDTSNAGVREYVLLLQMLPELISGLNLQNVEQGKIALFVFRWIAEHLNLALHAAGIKGSGTCPPLLMIPAELCGHISFQRASECFYADDASRRERWNDVCPIAPLDEDWGRLREFLGVRSLAAAIEEEPLQGQNLPEETSRLWGRLREVFPELAALAHLTQPAKVETVLVPRLKRLQVSVVRDLKLRERLAGLIGSERMRTVLAVLTESQEILPRGGRVRIGRLITTGEFGDELFAAVVKIARHVEADRLADALALLLSSSLQSREAYLRARGVSLEVLQRMRQAFGQEELELQDVLTDALVAMPHASDVPTAPIAKDVRSQGIGSASATAPEYSPQNSAQTFGDDRASPAFTPPLDLEAIHIENYTPSQATASDGGDADHGGNWGGTGFHAAPDWQRLEMQRRADGRRGEEAVFLAEQRRLTAAGRSDLADRIIWVADKAPTADHDFESFEPDGTPIMIEVKSTSSESMRFPCSIAELRLAACKRDNYFIYRVTRVRDANPLIYRVRDPFKLFIEERLRFDFKDLYLELPPPAEQETVVQPETELPAVSPSAG